MIAIDKEIPIPESRKSTGRKRMYPFHDLDVGDSFFVETNEPHHRVKSLLQSVRKSRFPDKKFTTRIVNGGVRCWRVK